MPPSTGPSPSSVASSRDSLMAMGAGALIGIVVMHMAAQRGESGLSLAMAVLFVLSGSASVVLGMLSRPHRLKPAQRRGEIKGWLLSLGLGVLGAVQVGALIS